MRLLMPSSGKYLRPRIVRRLAVLLILVAGTSVLPGCNILGWAANAVGGGKRSVKVEARYTKLDHHSIAVMVAASDITLFHYPDAPYRVSQAVSRHLADHLKKVTLMDPHQVIRFQRDNPYWTAMRYGRLIKKMHVDRLVLIDLIDYRTHEPGNTHVWKGVIDANVGVVSAAAADPDNFVFYQHVRIEFPPDTTVGVVDSNNQTMQLGMVTYFAERAAGLFYTHKENAE